MQLFHRVIHVWFVGANLGMGFLFLLLELPLPPPQLAGI